jgi:Tfp pilus assembly protein PilO
MRNMDKLKQTMVIALVAVIVVAAGGWHFLISPQRSSVSSLNAQAAAVDTKNTGIKGQIDQLKSQLADVPDEQLALAAIAKRLPPDLQEANLLDDLSHAADAANVDLLAITPSAPMLASAAAVAAPAPVASGAAKPGPKAPVAAPNQLYQIPVSLTVTGNYFDLEMYIHTLEGMQRAMLIQQLSFSKSSAATGSGSTTLTGTGATASGAPTTGAAVTTAPTTTSKTTGKSSTGSSKSAKSTAKPVPGSADAAQAELDRQVQVLSDSDTLSVTITGEVFSMYSPAAATAAAAAVTATPAPTK